MDRSNRLFVEGDDDIDSDGPMDGRLLFHKNRAGHCGMPYMHMIMKRQ